VIYFPLLFVIVQPAAVVVDLIKKIENLKCHA